MRKILVVWLCCTAVLLSAQQDSLLQIIATQSCTCIKTTDTEVDLEMMIGICLLDASTPHKAAITQQLDLDLDNVDNYQTLGELVAPYLIESCPEFQTLMLDEAAEKDEQERWSDIEGPAVVTKPKFGDPGNKQFITTPMPNTNSVGISKPKLTGKIKFIQLGDRNTVGVKVKRGKLHTLELPKGLVGHSKLKKGKVVTLVYKVLRPFNSSEHEVDLVKLVTKIE